MLYLNAWFSVRWAWGHGAGQPLEAKLVQQSYFTVCVMLYRYPDPYISLPFNQLQIDHQALVFFSWQSELNSHAL